MKARKFSGKTNPSSAPRLAAARSVSSAAVRNSPRIPGVAGHCRAAAEKLDTEEGRAGSRNC